MSRKNVQGSRLKPTLGLFDATAVSVGAIIGAGIFVVTGIAAGLAGSAIVVSMLIAAIVSLFTALSFAELKDLPQALSKLHPKYNSPYHSVWIVGILMTLLVLFIDLTKVVAISTFAMLFYYAIANVSALRLKAQKRVYPSVVPALGAVSCLALLVFILFTSPHAWIIGVAGLIAGAIYYVLNKRQGMKKTAS